MFLRVHYRHSYLYGLTLFIIIDGVSLQDVWIKYICMYVYMYVYIFVYIIVYIDVLSSVKIPNRFKYLI